MTTETTTWFADTIKMADTQGYRVTPVFPANDAGQNNTTGRYANDPHKTYTDLKNYTTAKHIGVILDNVLLLDYDANKDGAEFEIPSLMELAQILGLDKMPDPVQTNAKGTSLHFLFRLDARIDIDTLKASQDNWMPYIDIKCKNQLMHLKPKKTICGGVLPSFNHLPLVPQKLMDALSKNNEASGGKVPNGLSYVPTSLYGGEADEVSKAEEILKFVHPDESYSDWIATLMGIHEKFGNSEQGISIADTWSAQGSSYKGRRDIEHKFSTFKGDGTTFASVAHKAKQNGADLSAIAKSHMPKEPLIPAPIFTLGSGTKPLPVVVADIEIDEEIEGVGVSCHKSPLDMLLSFSARDEGDNMRKQMLTDVFVLDRIAILGQWSVIYASPNSGKTLFTLWLITEQIRSGLINGEDVFYVNVDDTFKGGLQKADIAKRFGFHILLPSQKDFKINNLVEILVGLTETKQAKGKVIILDTLKKFTNIMDKQNASEFGNVCRTFIAAGGTIIALAHTNKHKGENGKSVYSGTSDIVDDADCVFLLDEIANIEDGDGTVEKTIQFTNIKNRGDVDNFASFKYVKVPKASYADLFNSVERLGDDDVVQAKRINDIEKGHEDDTEVITIVQKSLAQGRVKKWDLITFVTEQTGIAKRKVIATVARWEGTSPSDGHLWIETKGDRNSIFIESIKQTSSWDEIDEI